MLAGLVTAATFGTNRAKMRRAITDSTESMYAGYQRKYVAEKTDERLAVAEGYRSCMTCHDGLGPLCYDCMNNERWAEYNAMVAMYF